VEQQDDDEVRRQHEEHRRQMAAILAAQVELAADLARLRARLDARAALWRGEDGFDG
jgi:hypothetical protein